MSAVVKDEDKEETRARRDGAQTPAALAPSALAPDAPATAAPAAPDTARPGAAGQETSARQASAPGSAAQVAGSEEPAPGATRTLRDRLRLPLMVGVPLIAFAGGLYYYLTTGRYQSTDDAYVQAAEVSVSSNVSGRVSEVDVRDNERVRRGQTLFRLDPRPFRIAVEAARARLASARLQVKALEATYRQRQADLKSAQSALAYAQREYGRQMRLLKSGITSQAKADRALLARNQAEQNVAAAQESITSTLASLGGEPNLPVDRHPSVQQAQAALDHALLRLSYTVIAAPIDGIVTRVDQIQVGDYLNAAAPDFALVATRDVWVRANFKEVQLAHMRPGQSADVWIDAYPGRTFEARVASESPGTGSQFSLLPPENATGNWVKVVQRLPVRIELVGKIPDLQTGLSATVRVDTQYHRSLLGWGGDRVSSANVASANAPAANASPPSARAGD